MLWIVSRWVFRLHRHDGPAWWYSLRAATGLLVRAALIFCVGLPYVLATMMTYRPRMAATQDPQTLYHWNFETVEFPATDGTRIVGWWIPAIHGDSSKTVLLCPGTNADMATQLPLVRRLVPDGYNVLVFDFRAHGESGGQLCSFGDLERQDVLGAMRWLRQNHPQACKKVAGLGVSGGAAALLAAAADDSPEGQNIDAIAVYDTYDRLDNEVASLSNAFIPQPLSWFVNHLGLPMAGYQVGADLSAFAPATEIKSVSPRPVLVIHGMDDEFIPFEAGQDLYDSAAEPKMNFWINRCGHEQAIKNEAAAGMVRQCFDAAQRVI
jgi:alpha-beta hydrolase superfamily lysophospholipase